MYVCTFILYDYAKWGSCLWADSGDFRWDCTGKFGTNHRNALQVILGVGNDVQNELMYVSAAEWPLKLQIVK